MHHKAGLVLVVPGKRGYCLFLCSSAHRGGMTVTGTSAALAVGWIGPDDQGLPVARAIAEAGFPLHA